MRENLTDRFAATVKPTPGKSNERYFDINPKSPRGLLLRVTPAGARAWALQYRIKGTIKQREFTIGDTASWPIVEARKRAAELRRVVDSGGDPLGEVQDKRGEPTVEELAARYVAEVLPKLAPRTQAENRSQLRDYILPALGKKKVAAVEREDIERLHRRISEAGKPRRANTVKALTSVLFSKAIGWKLRADNPARGVEANVEHNRERFLSDNETERLIAVLDRWQAKAKRPDSVDTVRLLMLTGARRGEVLAMTWEQLDLDAGTWFKSPTATKQRRSHLVPLSAEAVRVLRRRLAERDAGGQVVALRRDPHVFRGGGNVSHSSRLERDWREIRAAAGVEDLRMHDLRHCFASTLVGAGLSLPIIGALLGHSKPATTARYSHLRLGPLREATEIVAAKLGGGKGPK